MLSAQKLLLYEPLLQWYVSHGAKITTVYRTINYQATKWFVDEVTAARRTGDADKSKALLADIFKLLGNSSYGKMIESLERQTRVIYTKDEKLVDRALRSAYFEDLDEIGQAYELESRKPRILIRRPFQIGITVYQLAKLRLLNIFTKENHKKRKWPTSILKVFDKLVPRLSIKCSPPSSRPAPRQRTFLKTTEHPWTKTILSRGGRRNLFNPDLMNKLIKIK